MSWDCSIHAVPDDAGPDVERCTSTGQDLAVPVGSLSRGDVGRSIQEPANVPVAHQRRPAIIGTLTSFEPKIPADRRDPVEVLLAPGRLCFSQRNGTAARNADHQQDGDYSYHPPYIATGQRRTVRRHRAQDESPVCDAVGPRRQNQGVHKMTLRRSRLRQGSRYSSPAHWTRATFRTQTNALG